MRSVYLFCKNCNQVMEEGICLHSQDKKKDAFGVNVFQPYFSSTLGQVTSLKHEQKLLKSKDLSFTDDHYAMRKKFSDTLKNREEIIRDRYAKEGIKYTPNSNTRFDEKNKRFVPAHGEAPKKLFFYLFIFMLIPSLAWAKLEGVEYTTIEVNGESYDIPLANKDYEHDIYMLKKALRKDKEALEIFVGNNDHKDFFIGDENPRWIRVYKDGDAIVTSY